MNKSMANIFVVFVFALFFIGISVYADSGEEAHGKPLETVLQEIRGKYGIGPNEAINPRKLSDAEL
jgi:hypothetical protein